jgi:hypothetical protein
MNWPTNHTREEFERIRRVSDMLCTGHADLRDRYARYAFALDISILAMSTWIVALAFIDPKLSPLVTPFKIDPQIWTGVLGTFTFFLSILQLRVDWKGRADSHSRSLEIYAEVKRLTGHLLSSGNELDNHECNDVLSRYHMATIVGTSIPEREFLRQKRRHLTKIAVSKFLDTHPAASIFILRIRLCLRDNFKQIGASK